ncbi:MAG: ribose-5-phosphate isomerase A [Thermomicrobiales bacterium]
MAFPAPIALRASGDGTFMTDGGHYILDASFGRIPDADALASSLNDIPGVVEHGLFINMASLAIIAGPAGARTLTAKESDRSTDHMSRITTSFGRTLAATLIVSAGLVGAAKAQDVSDEQVKAARAAIDAIGATAGFNNILPGLSMRTKSALIQASPNHEAEINAVVDEQALALAPRRADLEREAATTYAKTFSMEELKAIADFSTTLLLARSS